MAESEIKLTVGEEKVKADDVTKGHVVDMLHRDPEHLHDRLKVHFVNYMYTFTFILFTRSKLLPRFSNE